MRIAVMVKWYRETLERTKERESNKTKKRRRTSTTISFSGRLYRPTIKLLREKESECTNCALSIFFPTIFGLQRESADKLAYRQKVTSSDLATCPTALSPKNLVLGHLIACSSLKVIYSCSAVVHIRRSSLDSGALKIFWF